jgi:hypothetical protein
MNALSLVAGALTLRTDTFERLKERSDVFYRGFLVLLLVGILAGAFSAGEVLLANVFRPPSESQVTQEVIRGFENSFRGTGDARSTVEPYVTEAVAMGFELSRLPPNAGSAFRPIARLLNWLGGAVSIPLGGGFLGFLLLAGVFVHLASRWLGGRANFSQMLGLSALALAPHLLDTLSSLLKLAGDLSGAGVFGPVQSLIGFIVLGWGAVIYAKATAIAEGFSYGRALVAMLVALGLAALIFAAIAFAAGALVAGLIASLVAAAR